MNNSAGTRGLALGIAVLLGGYLLLTSTVTLHETLWKFDVKRILELGLFPLIFSTVLFNRALRAAFREQLERIPRWVATVLLVLLALGVASSAYNASSTMSLLYSLAEVSLLSLWLVAVLAVAACRQAAGTVFDQVAIALIALVGLAVGVQELTGVFAAWSVGMEFHPRIALLHFSWPRFYNQVQAWSMPVIAALPLVFPGRPLAKFFCVAALVLEWYVLIATGARGTMVAITGALLAAAAFLPAIRKTLIGYQLAGLFGAIFIYALVVFGHQQLVSNEPAGVPASPHSALSKAEPGQSQQKSVDHSADQAAAIRALGERSESFTEPLTGERIRTSSGRIAMWRGILRDAQAHPLLGIGPMNYACKGPIYRAAHPHNFPLQFMAEWGMPAVLLLMFTAVVLLFKLAVTLRTPDASFVQSAPLAAYFATGVLAALILACLDGVLSMPASQVTGVLVCGCLLGLLPGWTANKGSSAKALLVLTLALAVSFAFLAFARQEISVAELRWEQTPVMDRAIPRLWQNGKVCALYQQSGQ
ncbi:MAG TPA: O-antigen ligase family protein [Xanthomonadales bacterium]|nr:O-antigen ligase family protein [Xanthomonadales bacterium]